MKSNHLLKIVAFSLIAADSISTKVHPDEPVKAFTTNQGEIRVDIGKEGRPVTVMASAWDASVLFLIDTGAGRSAIDLQLALQRADKIGHELIKSPSGASIVPVYRCDRIAISEFELAVDLDILAVDLTQIRHITGEHVFGILGTDVLRNFAISFDFDSGSMVIGDSLNEKATAGASEHKLTWIQNCPAIQLNLPNATPHDFLVNKGADLTSLRHATCQNLAENHIRLHKYFISSAAVNGEFQSTSGILEWLKVGEHVIPQKLVISDPHFAIGLDILSRFKIAFDFPNNTVFVKPGDSLEMLESIATSGIGLAFIDGKTVVSRVRPEGPAQQAGILVGDVLLSIDGEDASYHDMHSFKRVLTSIPGRTVTLQVSRNGLIEEVSATLAER